MPAPIKMDFIDLLNYVAEGVDENGAALFSDYDKGESIYPFIGYVQIALGDAEIVRETDIN